MIDISQFEDLVTAHLARLRGTIRLAATSKSLGTVDEVTTHLVKTMYLADMIRTCHSYETVPMKIAAFKAVIDWYVKWAVRREQRPGGFYAQDTFPTSFNTGDILAYKPPGQS